MKEIYISTRQAEEKRWLYVEDDNLIAYSVHSVHKSFYKGNIYTATIVSIESYINAIFVDYGDERNGFLPFSEIRDFYRKEEKSLEDSLKVGDKLLVQVVKEERGSKGVTLTTYCSLAGAYLVLLPFNESKSGFGVSKQSTTQQRIHAQNLLKKLDVPEDMTVIVRTAGLTCDESELKWDLEQYLLRLWNNIIAAANDPKNDKTLIYHENNLAKIVRDYFRSDVNRIVSDTVEDHKQLQNFMNLVYPESVDRLVLQLDQEIVPAAIERQIQEIYKRTVTLPSGAEVIFDHAEALIAIDVNSARAKKGKDIVETAVNINLEAAACIGRQILLRDLGGLIVIDFIDMLLEKHRKLVEAELRKAMKFDHVRLHIGKISNFGLLELSRQRNANSLNDISFTTCLSCNGSGRIRQYDNLAVNILRDLNVRIGNGDYGSFWVSASPETVIYLLNEKREELYKLEAKGNSVIKIIPNSSIDRSSYKIERQSQQRKSVQVEKESSESERTEWKKKLNVNNSHEDHTRHALVENVLPDNPKPKSTNSGSSLGLWKRIKYLMFGSPEEQVNSVERIKPSPRNNGQTQNQRRSRRSPRRNNRPRSEGTNAVHSAEDTSKASVTSEGSQQQPRKPRARRPHRSRPSNSATTRTADAVKTTNSSPAENDAKNLVTRKDESKAPESLSTEIKA